MGKRLQGSAGVHYQKTSGKITYDNNYFNDLYQGIPIGGYNVLIEKLFQGCDIETGVDYNQHREKYKELGEKILYTGTIDSFL